MPAGAGAGVKPDIVQGCYTTQMEHTVLIKASGGKEIVSRGDDY